MKCVDYLDASIVEWPSLYSSDTSLHDARLKVCNQFFNVIGNGIRDDNELLEHIQSLTRAKPLNNIEEFALQQFFYGCTDIDGFNHDIITVSEKDKINHPEIKQWKSWPKHQLSLYPNFKEDYSLIWNCPIFFTLGDDWVEWAIIFYSYCKEWLEKNEYSYSYAFPPSAEREITNQLNSFAKNIEKYKSHKEISEAYKQDYYGDNYDFLVRRWQKERERIMEFIDKTIDMLEGKLLRSKSKPNRNIRSKIMVNQHTLEELLNMKVDTKNKDGKEIKITP